MYLYKFYIKTIISYLIINVFCTNACINEPIINVKANKLHKASFS